MYPLKNYLCVLFLLVFNSLLGQNYHAINGSSFAGSLGASSNPASIVDAPDAWDITPLAIQLQHSTNAFIIKNYSLLSSAKKAQVVMQNETKKRFLFANQDIRLLNTRISLNEKSAIAFGVNIRNYIYALNSKSNWQDTISALANFMKINIGNLPLSGEFAGSAWSEVYGTYARTIIDDGKRSLNAGITLKLNKALAGGYANASELSYSPVANGNGYLLNKGNLQYGYSSNFDNNRRALLKNLYSGITADVGIEYLSFPDESLEESSDDIYDTKIGIAIMDIGSNKYRYGENSRLASAGKEGVTDSIIENRFSGVSTPDDFNDTLAGIANIIRSPTGNFFIYEPTRLVINVDKHVAQNFFVNAEITLPLISLVSKNTLFIKDINLLALTPRWETKSLGAYLPILFNSKNQLWLGGAFKAGPVLFGIHNLGNLFLKNKTQTGGLYLAFTVRPGKKHDQGNGYSRDKLTGKVKRSMQCPKL